MKRAAIALLICASSASAGPIANWGGTNCTIEQAAQQQHIATVTCTNQLTGGDEYNEGVLSIGGLSVRLVATFYPGEVPDNFKVVTPEGFIAVPPEITIYEGQSGTILIFATAAMLLG